MILFLIFFGITVVLNLSEASIIALDDSKLKGTAEDSADSNKDRALRILKYLKNPAKFRKTALINKSFCILGSCVFFYDFINNTLVKYVLDSVYESGHEVSHIMTLLCSFLTFAVCGFIIITLGKLIPENLGAFWAEKTAFSFAFVFGVLTGLFKPLSFLVDLFVKLMMKLFSVDMKKLSGRVTEEDIRMLIDAGNENGTIEESQKEMINNIFEFDDITADEVMTHRVDILGVSDKYKISEIVSCAINEGFSRIPVYSESMDNITGIINVKDLLCLVGVNPDDYEISHFIRPVIYVPESVKCRDLFREFSYKKIHFAVVVDDYGGTAGIVTMEDLIESIVGNIQDEYDDEQDDIIKMNDNTFIMDGSTLIEDAVRRAGIQLEDMSRDDDDNNYETVGGLIIHLLERIPEEGETPVVSYGNAEFTVILIKDRHISKVKAVVMPNKSKNSEDS